MSLWSLSLSLFCIFLSPSLFLPPLYLSPFNNRKEMEKAIMDREPPKIDIGAVYNAKVC